MVKVITYGTYDYLHHGHIQLLKRARALGDYLIVGVTADDFDKARGKINVEQSLMERIEAVKATGLADEVIAEEYEGQKIDDIKRYDVDIFTVGSDWQGKFDYLNAYCRVVYLPRTEGVSSSEIRTSRRCVRVGACGGSACLLKFIRECGYVNGVRLTGICTHERGALQELALEPSLYTDRFEELLECSDAVYIASHPKDHVRQIEQALARGVHVLCESPIALNRQDCERLMREASERGLVLMEGIKTAYSVAYSRLLLLVQSQKIGQVVSVDATCTSIRNIETADPVAYANTWNTITEWGPVGLLPVFQILGTAYDSVEIVSKTLPSDNRFDVFSRISLTYPGAVASIRIGKGVKSEGELIISGTGGYIYVPAPWWKTDYFEARFENPADNRRYFYQLDGEGIRYEIVAFVKAVEGKRTALTGSDFSAAVSGIMEAFYQGEHVRYLQ